MLDNPSLITRVAIGKGVGFVVGLVGLITLPFFMPDASWLLRWGVLFWYTTVGAVIGVFGVFTWHPIMKLPMPWWFRSTVVGAWMNFVLTFFVYDDIKNAMVHTFGSDGALSSPFWMVLEGAVVGIIIGYFATRFGGEGKETVEAVNR
jgi:hypothetical protein